MRLAVFYPWHVLFDGQQYTTDAPCVHIIPRLAEVFESVDLICMLDDSNKEQASEVIDTSRLRILPLPFCANGKELHLTKVPQLLTSLFRMFWAERKNWDAVLLGDIPQPNQWVGLLSWLFRKPMVLMLAGSPGKGMEEAHQETPGASGWIRRVYGRWLFWLTVFLAKRLPTLADIEVNRLYPKIKSSFHFYAFSPFKSDEGILDTHKDRNSDQPFNILSVSRITPVKGIENLIEAAGILQKQGIDIRVEIAGPAYGKAYNNYEGRLQSMIQDLQLEHTVIMSGALQRPELKAAYDRAHIMVMSATSDAEGIPKVVLEALGFGLPVVSTDVGACRRVVHDNANGFLTPPKDPAALAAAIKRLAQDHKQYYDFSEEALKIAGKYTLDPQAQEIVEYIQSVL